MLHRNEWGDSRCLRVIEVAYSSYPRGSRYQPARGHWRRRISHGRHYSLLTVNVQLLPGDQQVCAPISFVLISSHNRTESAWPGWIPRQSLTLK
jgi:hypothetical protein